MTTIRQTRYCQVEISWVKGHQDASTAPLTVEALYNIRADALAGAHTPDPSSSTDGIGILPAERCRLKINSTPIQGHYEKHIRHSYTTPAYYRYLEQRHGWTSTQLMHLDWPAYRRAASNTPIDHVQLTKLVHNKLPTNSELAKSNPHQAATCHYCAERETFHHLLTCNNPLSTAFRERIYQVVEVYLSNQGVPESLAAGILYAIKRSLGINQDPVSPPRERMIALCLEEQQNYGHKLLQGYITGKWRDTYDRIRARYGEQEHTRNSIDVFAGLIKLLWHEQLKLWETHILEVNSFSRNTPKTTCDKLAMYKSKVRQLHLLREECLPGHRDQYFHPDLESFLEQATISRMKQYLHHYEPAIQVSIRMAKEQPIRTLFTFPGFTRTVHRTPNLRTLGGTSNHQLHSSPPDQSTNGTQSNVFGGAPINRKHTRWKTMTNAVQSIRKFFTQPPD